MRDASFYSMIAQVIPTLLIAVALQFVAIRRAAHAAGYMLDEREAAELMAANQMPVDWLVVMTALLGMLVVVAEASAVIVLLVGVDTWFSYVAGPLCAFAAIVLTLVVAWVFWMHLVQLSVGRKL